jgi:hypothetical protein
MCGISWKGFDMTDYDDTPTPTLTITRAQYDEFVESAEDHTILWTDTLALIGVYVAPCQTKIDV